MSSNPDAGPDHHIEFTLNGEETTARVPPHRTLVELLRGDRNLRGTTQGCGVGVCGCCTVLVDGDMVSSCIELAVNVDGAEVWTVEGLEAMHDGGGLHPLQEAFRENEGFQCGYCTPGVLMSASALLRDVPDPSREDVEAYLSENICRCTGYEPIVESIQAAADRSE